MAQAPEVEAGHPETDTRWRQKRHFFFLKGGVRYKVTHDEPSPSDADVNSPADSASTRCRH